MACCSSGTCASRPRRTRRALAEWRVRHMADVLAARELHDARAGAGAGR
ncbi:hypothetical protein JOF35_004759 [Streptomyces demainii]|uniref:Uncharacterized protein n=1 Tax=Streptomyces demainii TaxID=588122 RepID=A0ABT9KVK6_9ACTN|nr:hypothetical protein [Streptomyces demainii]